jgi:SpoVK/Ycf46/Vps4 family AAA+-type ATPase
VTHVLLPAWLLSRRCDGTAVIGDMLARAARGQGFRRSRVLYGPPGCGKTLIAKAVANSLAKQVAVKTAQDGGTKEGKSFFLNIKGPELLNKYVGETERHIRLVFQRAREKASEGMPVIVFFDEMDSIFRTRGSGVSSDVENTIVPQLLSEIDGVEGLENVIVIGASNREDMIDPAILHPGRLDVKIKIERPDAEAARDIFFKYVLSGLPLHPDDLAEHGGSPEACVEAMIQRVVERMYSETEENRFLEVTYANGDKEVLYFRDFNSGAIQNIVDRAKKMAIKEFLETGHQPAGGGDLGQGGRADDGRGGGPGRHRPWGRADPAVQEQHRQQGRLLRLPRELPDAPGHAVRGHRQEPDPVLRLPPGRVRGRAGRPGHRMTRENSAHSGSA